MVWPEALLGSAVPLRNGPSKIVIRRIKQEQNHWDDKQFAS